MSSSHITIGVPADTFETGHADNARFARQPSLSRRDHTR